jgi:gamma-glutamyltranspeptidase/glutathione hydrolase
MLPLLHRRDILLLAGASLVEQAAAQPPPRGLVAGHPEGAEAGQEMLSAGGNAVDAIVAAALVAGVISPQQCGPGGYGGHLIIARPNRRAVAIDFNTAAPRAARADMFPLDADGQVRGRANEFGWRASGVPGTLAGLQLALDRHGTLPLRQVLRPALRHARDGFIVSTGLATAVRSSREQLARDRAAARLLLPDGEPLRAGSRFRNPDLADLFDALAQANSVDSFYRGAIARRIAAAFAANDGLVTADDLAAYQAREVEPLELSWRGCRIFTAPLTAGGLTVLQALAVLRALEWERRDPADPRTLQLQVEALRLAWHDRVRLLGDPRHADVPVERLLSAEYARRSAARVEEAVRQGQPLPAATDGRPADGTIHLSAADREGTMVALTLTHGNHFGARVAVEELGLLLGHGMSRFDPHPGHPNAPGPLKRPLHNMCPTVIERQGQPILALGGRGGRRIPNAVFAVVTAYVGRQSSLEDAIAAARLHTEGDLRLIVERGSRAADVAHLRRVGYNVEEGPSAVVDAVARDPDTGALRAAGR